MGETAPNMLASCISLHQGSVVLSLANGELAQARDQLKRNVRTWANKVLPLLSGL